MGSRCRRRTSSGVSIDAKARPVRASPRESTRDRDKPHRFQGDSASRTGHSPHAAGERRNARCTAYRNSFTPFRRTAMSDTQSIAPTERYARAIAASKRIRWDIDNDVIRGRALDVGQKFLPDGLSLVDELPFLTAKERRFMSQVQGRTYANIFGLVERYINVKMLDRSRDHWFGDQVALEALVRFSDEELKHQELFRRVEALAASTMPPGYRLTADPNDVARFVLGKSTWAVLGLTSHIEIFTQVHYKKSIESDDNLSPL